MHTLVLILFKKVDAHISLDYCLAKSMHTFVLIFVLFRKKLFWPVVDVRHREKLRHWEFFFKSEMGGSKFIKGFQKCHVHMPEASTEHYFVFDFCAFP